MNRCSDRQKPERMAMQTSRVSEIMSASLRCWCPPLPLSPQASPRKRIRNRTEEENGPCICWPPSIPASALPLWPLALSITDSIDKCGDLLMMNKTGLARNWRTTTLAKACSRSQMRACWS